MECHEFEEFMDPECPGPALEDCNYIDCVTETGFQECTIYECVDTCTTPVTPDCFVKFIQRGVDVEQIMTCEEYNQEYPYPDNGNDCDPNDPNCDDGGDNGNDCDPNDPNCNDGGDNGNDCDPTDADCDNGNTDDECTVHD
jgi:hypothetical protein